MGKYIADLIRKRIKPSRNLSEASIHIQAYQDWRGSSGDDWLASELSYYASRNQREAAEERARLERERIAAMTPAERHKERLEKLGKEYLGVRPAAPNPLRHRTTHCYACKESLDNSIDIECAACGWILCDCGACGCGYSGLV